MLNPQDAANGIAEAYLYAAGLNEDGSPILDANGEPIYPDAPDFPGAFADAYDAYAKAGVVAGAKNNGGQAALLKTAVAAMDNSSSSIDVLAQAMASYWATVALEPGTPAHGGVGVVSVANDAAAQISAFKAAITASITDQIKKPYFLHFIQNVQSIGVAAVTWQVTETFANGSSATFPVKIV